MTFAVKINCPRPIDYQVSNRNWLYAQIIIRVRATTLFNGQILPLLFFSFDAYDRSYLSTRERDLFSICIMRLSEERDLNEFSLFLRL